MINYYQNYQIAALNRDFVNAFSKRKIHLDEILHPFSQWDDAPPEQIALEKQAAKLLRLNWLNDDGLEAFDINPDRMRKYKQ